MSMSAAPHMSIRKPLIQSWLDAYALTTCARDRNAVTREGLSSAIWSERSLAKEGDGSWGEYLELEGEGREDEGALLLQDLADVVAGGARQRQRHRLPHLASDGADPIEPLPAPCAGLRGIGGRLPFGGVEVWRSRSKWRRRPRGRGGRVAAGLRFSRPRARACRCRGSELWGGVLSSLSLCCCRGRCWIGWAAVVGWWHRRCWWWVACAGRDSMFATRVYSPPMFLCFGLIFLGSRNLKCI